MKVKEIMSKTVYSLSPNVNLEYASAIMRDKNLGVMPVTHQGKLLGIVTDRDILLRGVAQRRDLKTTTVSDIMTKNVVKILPDQSVIEASKMMAKNKIRRIPVCDGQRVVGIVSLCDIARQKGLNFEAASAIIEISLD